MVLLAAMMGLSLLASDQQASLSDPLETSVSGIVSSVERAYRDCGEDPAFPASVKVLTHPSLVSYQFSERTVIVSRYSELQLQIQQMMDMWATTAGMENGSALFSDIFNELLVPHEMGHWMQHVSRRALTLDRWQGEVEANRIAIAYWRLDPNQSARLPERVSGFVGFLNQIPNPVPEGSDPRAYFNENYDTFDAAQYGWFQGAFMREAWERRDEAGFCELAALNASASVDAFANDP